MMLIFGPLFISSFEKPIELSRKAPTCFGGLSFDLKPAWKGTVSGTPEERNVGLIEPF